MAVGFTSQREISALGCLVGARLLYLHPNILPVCIHMSELKVEFASLNGTATA